MRRENNSICPDNLISNREGKGEWERRDAPSCGLGVRTGQGEGRLRHARERAGPGSGRDHHQKGAGEEEVKNNPPSPTFHSLAPTSLLY